MGFEKEGRAKDVTSRLSGGEEGGGGKEESQQVNTKIEGMSKKEKVDECIGSGRQRKKSRRWKTVTCRSRQQRDVQKMVEKSKKLKEERL